MIHRLILALLSMSALFSTGCGLFSKKGSQPKESSAIASDVEATFRRRWVEKRAGELVAQGVEANAAQAQADAEFREKFGFANKK